VFNYTSWEGTRQLTATLLKADFGIEWWLPEGQLVPTVTSRANYIHWINDLLGLSSPEPEEGTGGWWLWVVVIDGRLGRVCCWGLGQQCRLSLP